MKRLILASLSCFAGAALVTGTLALAASGSSRAEEQKPKMEFDKYELVLLYAVPNRPTLPTGEADKIQAAHLAHLRAMAKAGKMFVAGPFDDQPDPALRGMCLYRVGSLAEARKLAEEDPSVKSVRARGATAAKLGVLYAEPLLGNAAVLAWATPGILEPTVATAVQEGEAAQAVEPPSRTLHIDANVHCARCGSSLAISGFNYKLTTVQTADLHFDVVPFCNCMYEWDGTAEDLLRSVTTVPTLEMIEGGAEGSGEPAGPLRLVDKGDSDDQEE